MPTMLVEEPFGISCCSATAAGLITAWTTCPTRGWRGIWPPGW
jgi:hypothetical protein